MRTSYVTDDDDGHTILKFLHFPRSNFLQVAIQFIRRVVD